MRVGHPLRSLGSSIRLGGRGSGNDARNDRASVRNFLRRRPLRSTTPAPSGARDVTIALPSLTSGVDLAFAGGSLAAVVEMPASSGSSYELLVWDAATGSVRYWLALS